MISNPVAGAPDEPEVLPKANDTSGPNGNSTLPIAAIAGGAGAGGAALLIGVFVGVWIWRRKAADKQRGTEQSTVSSQIHVVYATSPVS